MGNAQRMQDARSFLLDNKQLDSITIKAWASPEGPFLHNRWLARKRAAAAQSFLWKTGLRANYTQLPLDEDWDGLYDAVASYYQRPNRAQVMAILQNPEFSSQERKAKLKELDGGLTYRFLIDTLMAPLRHADIQAHWTERPVLICSQIIPSHVTTGPLNPLILSSFNKRPFVTFPSQKRHERTIVAVKTNLLFDAVTALNYGVEVPFGPHFSLAWEHYFPWWHSKKELRYCLQYLTLGGEARWWFAPKTQPATEKRQIRDALVGHYLGAYGFWGKSDLQWNQLGRYQVYPVWSAGLTYGFAFPVSKHLNLELSASVGYARIPYQHYTPSDNWQILWRDREGAGVLHYFGPTKVQVSLVWPIVVKW